MLRSNHTIVWRNMGVGDFLFSKRCKREPFQCPNQNRNFKGFLKNENQINKRLYLWFSLTLTQRGGIV
jgi:hypothetical protein